MTLRRVRVGELLALAGAVCVFVSLFLPSYRRATGLLDGWDTFGPAVALLLAAAVAACVLVVSNLMERTTAVPVAAAVWTVLFGLVAIVAAVVRLLERPDHVTGVRSGAWLALAGAVLIFLGAWRSMWDERRSLYEPASPEPRPGPPAASGGP
jgi:drug/metabolite transporter (DMT)-like permease